MIEDARKIPGDIELDCDICIVGAGAAGITLALELAQTGKSIILLEAGNRNNAGKSQKLYKGELVDPKHHLSLDSDRYRQLGGTTALWGGRCLTYDEIDFEHREFIPNSGWPIGFKDIEPFYKRAHVYCQCGEYDYLASKALPTGMQPLIPGFKDGNIITDQLERWSPPTRFGKQYRQQLSSLSNIRVFTNAICLQLVCNESEQHVSHLDVATFSGNKFKLKAEKIVLSGGGLEVTRMLLASNEKQGIGNHSDWLGRGYMCHVKGVIARVRFDTKKKIIFGYEVDNHGVYCRRRIMLSQQLQRQHGLLNLHMMLDRPLLDDASHNSGLMSLAFIIKQLLGRQQDVISGSGKYGLYWRHIRNILLGSPEMLSVLPSWSRSRFLQGRRIPSLLSEPKDNIFYLHYQAEQTPAHHSRVMLSEQCDPFGIPRLKVDFHISDQDVDSIYRSHLLLAQEFQSQNCGELIFNDDDPESAIREHKATLGHHIGTTRMANKASDGVVDSDCKVFGVDNLFISSSSVFPTSSHANPTLTIVAMAIRLAEHLKE